MNKLKINKWLNKLQVWIWTVPPLPPIGKCKNVACWLDKKWKKGKMVSADILSNFNLYSC